LGERYAKGALRGVYWCLPIPDSSARAREVSSLTRMTSARGVHADEVATLLAHDHTLNFRGYVVESLRVGKGAG